MSSRLSYNFRNLPYLTTPLKKKTGHNVKTLFKRLASAVLESETPSFPVGDKMVSVILHEANEEDAPVEKWGCC